MDPLIITAAITGAEVSKEDNPALPVTPKEIGKAAYDCYLAGASIIHVHARLNDGTPSQSKEIYEEILYEISKYCDVIVQVSTGGAIGMTIEERAEPLKLNPQMATLTTGSVNFGEAVFLNTPVDIQYLYDEMLLRNIYPEFEIFDIGMLENANRLINNSPQLPNYHYDFVMGVPGAIPATIENLIHLYNQLPPNSTWSVAGIGRFQLPLAIHAMLMNGHVRVGFEDNIYYRKGILAQSNAQLVHRIHQIAQCIDRPIATVEEAKNILKLNETWGNVYEKK